MAAIGKKAEGDREIEVKVGRVNFSVLLDALAQQYEVNGRALVRPGRHRRWVRPRSLLVYLGRQWSGMSTKELGMRLHRDPSIISWLYATYAAGRDLQAEARLAQKLH